MPRPLLRFAQILMIAALFAAGGGHWVVLQTIAWTKMIASYSQDCSVSTALAKTFDGRHPCELCKSIANGRAGEKKQQAAQIAIPKLDFIHSRSTFTLVRAESSWEFRIPAFLASARADAPLTPPPRTA